MKPFTYYLYHPQTNTHYYGVRYAKNCNPTELWTTYFSSSKKVKDLIRIYGKESFTYRVRKTFSTKQEAILWEKKVLRRLKVLDKVEWLNANIAGAIQYETHPKGMLGKRHTEESKIQISKRTKGKTYEEIYGDRAHEEKKKRSNSHKNISKPYLKDKTYEEIYGSEKASQLRQIRSNRKGFKVENFRKPDKKPCPHCGLLYDPGNLKKHLNRIANLEPDA